MLKFEIFNLQNTFSRTMCNEKYTHENFGVQWKIRWWKNWCGIFSISSWQERRIPLPWWQGFPIQIQYIEQYIYLYLWIIAANICMSFGGFIMYIEFESKVQQVRQWYNLGVILRDKQKFHQTTEPPFLSHWDPI